MERTTKVNFRAEPDEKAIQMISISKRTRIAKSHPAEKSAEAENAGAANPHSAGSLATIDDEPEALTKVSAEREKRRANNKTRTAKTKVKVER